MRVSRTEPLFAALTLAFAEGLLGVVLGENVPWGVGLGVFAVEALLAWLTFCGLLFIAARTPWLRDPVGQKILLCSCMPWALGIGWLTTHAHARILIAAWVAWTAGIALLAAAARWLLAKTSTGIRTHRFRPALLGFALLCASGFAALSRIPGATDTPGHLARAGAGYALLGFALAVALFRGASSRPVPAVPLLPEPLRIPAAGVCYLAVLSAAVPAAPGPRDGRARIDEREPTFARAAPDRAPNLVFVSIDTLRADHVGCYGYARDTTPRLDELCAEGVMFEQPVSTSPWTLPSHSSLFTSLHPGELDEFRVDGHPTLATVLRERGYRTAAFTAGFFVDERHFGDGFELYVDDLEDAYLYGFPPSFLRPALVARRGLRHFGLGCALLNPWNHWRSAEGGKISAWAGPGPSAKAAAEWMGEVASSERPFFLFYHTFGAHEYHLVTAELRELADAWVPDYDGWLRRNNVGYGARPPSAEEDLEYFVALYDAGIRLSDRALGELLDAVDERGARENTLVVVTSDHGEGFRPDLGRTWHRGRLHEDLLRVPLVLRMPSRIEAGTTVGTQVSAVDVLPTVLELMGIAAPDGARGRSLAPLRADGTPGQGPVFADLAEYQPGPRGSMIRTGPLKFIRSDAGGEELYDLDADPSEVDNLVEARPEVLPSLRTGLDEYDARSQAATPTVDREAEKRLRALGYIQ